MAKIATLIESLPKEWQEKVVSDFAKMKTESPTLTDPKLEKQKFTISAIIQPEQKVREEISSLIAPIVKDDKGLFAQPADGYHFTIQWSDFMNGDMDKLVASLENVELPPLELEIKLVYPSKPNLFAVLIPKNDVQWMTKVRESLTGLLNSSSFSPKLPVKLPLIWMSLVRFTKEFDPRGLNELVEKLPEKTILANKFTFYLAKTDPYFTRSTAEIFFSKEF